MESVLSSKKDWVFLVLEFCNFVVIFSCSGFCCFCCCCWCCCSILFWWLFVTSPKADLRLIEFSFGFAIFFDLLNNPVASIWFLLVVIIFWFSLLSLATNKAFIKIELMNNDNINNISNISGLIWKLFSNLNKIFF